MYYYLLLTGNMYNCFSSNIVFFSYNIIKNTNFNLKQSYTMKINVFRILYLPILIQLLKSYLFGLMI